VGTKEEGIFLVGLTRTEIVGAVGLEGTRCKLPPIHNVEGEMKLLKDGDAFGKRNLKHQACGCFEKH
jgi:hypothetical protein